MLEDILNGGIVKLGELYDGMGDLSAFAIPVRDEVLRLIHVPLIKIIMELDPVLPELGSDLLGLKACPTPYQPQKKYSYPAHIANKRIKTS
jgi:hypothetical protein